MLIVVVVVVLLLLLRNHIGVLEVVPAALGGLLLEARIFGVDGILLEWRRRLLDYGEAGRWELLLELLLLWNKRRRIRFKLLTIVTCGLNNGEFVKGANGLLVDEYKNHKDWSKFMKKLVTDKHASFFDEEKKSFYTKLTPGRSHRRRK